MKSIGRATALVLVASLLSLTASTVAAQEGDGGDGNLLFFWMVFLIIALILVFAMYMAVVTIRPYEVGLKVVLGKYWGKMMPGLNFVPPFITKVVRMDLREMTLDVPAQEVLYRDRKKGVVDARIIVRVVDPEKAFFQVASWKLATVALAQTVLRNKLLELTFDELVDNVPLLGQEIIDKMHEDMGPWGVHVRKFDIGEMREN